MSSSFRVCVVGGGAWGTALAVVANRAGSDVTLFTRNASVIDAIRENRMNDIHLPGIFIDPGIHVTDDFTLVAGFDIIIVAVPSQCVRSLVISISDLVDVSVPIVVGTKGIERGSLLLMSEVVNNILPNNPVAIISGPNFADETARGQPTATTVACTNNEVLQQIIYAIGGKLFRPYGSDDVIGTQIGGAVKNVIAIACGICSSLDLGENARAALITRGFAEISRLAAAKGGRPETLMGLSGIGDLLLTCSSPKSRNTSLGMKIGAGRKLEEVLPSNSRGVAEGSQSVESVVRLARKFGISMPICEAVHAILYEDADIQEVVQELLHRPFTLE